MVQQRDPVCSTSFDTIGRAVAGELRLWVGKLVIKVGRSRIRDNRLEGASIDVDNRDLILDVFIYIFKLLLLRGCVKGFF